MEKGWILFGAIIGATEAREMERARGVNAGTSESLSRAHSTDDGLELTISPRVWHPSWIIADFLMLHNSALMASIIAPKHGVSPHYWWGAPSNSILCRNLAKSTNGWKIRTALA
jgi:hypothetical protein